MTTVSFDDADSTNKDILFRQYASLALTANQTITGAQALKFQIRAQQGSANNNMFTALGIRVVASDGTTIQKTVLSVTRDNVEGDNAVLKNRQFTATSAATNYTTVAGDRLLIEIGTGGDPAILQNHDSDLRIGDNDTTDLPEDDTTTADNNPWIELTDTLTFVAVVITPTAVKFISQAVRRSVTH